MINSGSGCCCFFLAGRLSYFFFRCWQKWTEKKIEKIVESCGRVSCPNQALLEFWLILHENSEKFLHSPFSYKYRNMFRIVARAPRILPYRRFTTTPSLRFFDKGPTAEEQAQALEKVSKVVAENPELYKLMVEFKQLLEKKGFETGAKPSMTQMFKLLADKDIREHGAKFKHFLETTDTGLTQNEIATVSGAFLFKNKDIK